MKRFYQRLLSVLIPLIASMHTLPLLCASSDCVSSCEQPSIYCTSSACRGYPECEENQYRCRTHSYFGKTHFSPRPQGTHIERLMIGSSGSQHAFDRSENSSAVSVALHYNQTYDDAKLAQWFLPNGLTTVTFGPSFADLPTNIQSIQNSIGFCISSSRVDARGIDFGLSKTFKSTVCIRPTSRTVGADIDCWINLNECFCGLWARLNVPFVYTSWEVDLNEKVETSGGVYYPQQIVETLGTPGFNLVNPLVPVAYHSAQEAWCGNKPFGDAPKLDYGKLCCLKKTAFNLAGIRVDVGLDILHSECNHLGIGITGVADVGTKVTSEYLFEPIVGTRSWQLGATFSAAHAFTLRYAELDVHLDGTITHLFKSKQRRLFGLKNNGPWSQYLLLKEFRPDSNNNVVYNRLERAANILAADVKVSNDIMLDIAAMAHYHTECGLSLKGGVGYWYRSKEKFDCCCPFSIKDKTYGIKGNIGLDAITTTLTPITDPYTASKSTIGVSIPDLDAQGNPTTVYLSNDDIDPCPALHPHAMTVTVFSAIEKHWYDQEFTPFVLIGNNISFSQGNAALCEWGVTLKGGLEF